MARFAPIVAAAAVLFAAPAMACGVMLEDGTFMKLGASAPAPVVAPAPAPSYTVSSAGAIYAPAPATYQVAEAAAPAALSCGLQIVDFETTVLPVISLAQMRAAGVVHESPAPVAVYGAASGVYVAR